MRSFAILLATCISCFILFAGRTVGHVGTMRATDTLPKFTDSVGWFFNRDDDSICVFKFPDVTIRFAAYPGFRWVLTPSKDPNDTVDTQVDPGTTLQGKKITIESTILTDITVEQSYRTSVIINNGDEQVVLNNWVHYNSDVIAMPAFGNVYHYRPYTNEEKSRFPTVSMDELRKHLMSDPYYGKRITDLLNKAGSIHDAPLSVGIGIEQLRILATRKDNGVKITKTIRLVIEQPRRY